ncbi:hypothetical protein HYW44_00055 [Candidatus Daviesbacteria bacterium]|nr:hypothetical protein [Candidatus Daviesbacteria bacterium]
MTSQNYSGKGIIYYTDNRLSGQIFFVVLKQLLKANLSIVSVSLQPIDFGKNIVLNLTPGYITMMKQIIKGLEASEAKYVFFCEHDCLYPTSHFEFTPPRNDIFYYNANVWRWKYPDNYAVTYDRLLSLSGLAVNRKFALSHYKKRFKKIKEMNWDKDTRHEPLWARRWGYEPGTKKTKRGGFSDDDFETWISKYPIIDIRHGKTFSQSKVTLDSFIHKPENWRETPLDKIPGWDLKGLFNLS